MSELILVVEDEITLQETLAYNLKKQGYEVQTASDGITAIELARKLKPDLILLDIMLPGMDGFDVCRTLRKEMTTPILMLTARDDEIDRVVGLEVGGDDYMVKPFSLRELMARVKAMLRRVRLIMDEAAQKKIVESSEILTFGNLEIDLTRREIRLNGTAIAVKPREYDLLVYLAQNRGRAMTREAILENLWGWQYIGESRTVDVHIRWLREKIEEDPTHPKRIITVRGSGYRFDG